MKETTLFLSPHLDDVVLSCPGRILSEVAREQRVIVATLFTESEAGPHDRDLYRRRREEDQRAVEALGAETRWLGLPDAPFRRPFYSSFRTIVLEMHPEDKGYVAAVATAVRSLCDEVKPTSLHVPLGVGTHIDHRLTYAAVEHLVETGELDRGVTVYYEDRPYAFVRHHVRLRLAELGLQSADPVSPDLGPLSIEVLTEEFLSSFDDTPYVNSYLPPGAERASCRRRLVEKLTRPATSDLILRPEILTLRRGDLDRCIEAAGAYESQIGELFGSMERFAEAARMYTRWLGMKALYAERAWRR